MNIVFSIIILFSLLVSTFTSVLTLKMRNKKWLGMLSGFFINTLILVIATWFFYILDDEIRLFGFGHSGLYVLIFSIPILTWINFFILNFVRSRGMRTKD
ncbi:hypothetical protein [Bacillus sp. FJAT-27445]|uniref:hypothetical protein n=1 Tax=Bacillus sp. FJAT-27445 TaxID=1679166 RepID=UPI0007442A09|nr:hypothetical protein [Bacillus sp. FJAT-27445]